MVYDTPVLQEVGQASQLVLGGSLGAGDNAGNGFSLVADLALGLDE